MLLWMSVGHILDTVPGLLKRTLQGRGTLYTVTCMNAMLVFRLSLMRNQSDINSKIYSWNDSTTLIDISYVI